MGPDSKKSDRQLGVKQKEIYFFLKEPFSGLNDDIGLQTSKDTIDHFIWRPRLLRAKPEGISTFPNIIWWLFHIIGVFRSKEFGIALYYSDNKLVHRSSIFPKFFRFPFMRSDDIQVGDLWTCPTKRGMGLAKMALYDIAHVYSNQRIWYLCEEDNLASIKVAKKVGFVAVARGIRTKRLGLGLFGQFKIKYYINSHPTNSLLID